MRLRFTWAGLGFSITVIAAGTLAYLTANNLLFLILSCLLAAWLVSGFVNRLTLAGLSVDFGFPDHVCARRTTPARIRVHNEKSWMPSFSLHVEGTPRSVLGSALYFPLLPAGRVIEEPVDVYFARRGVHSEDVVQIRSRFPFGFSERRTQVTLRREATVYPSVDPQPGFDAILTQVAGEIEAQERGSGYDFYRIRPYEPMESARHVDWKKTAQRGELQVREFAREQEPLVEIFLDRDADGNSEWFEHAVDCCAFLSWEIAQRGARLRFRTDSFDMALPAQGDIYTILRYLATVVPGATKGSTGPERDDSIQVVVSAEPRRLAAAGWDRALVVGREQLGGAAAGASRSASGGAGAKLHHGAGTGGRGGPRVNGSHRQGGA